MRISKNDNSFQKGCKPYFADEIFEISAISTKKLPAYVTIDPPNKEEFLGKRAEKMFKLKINQFSN